MFLPSLRPTCCGILVLGRYRIPTLSNGVAPTDVVSVNVGTAAGRCLRQQHGVHGSSLHRGSPLCGFRPSACHSAIDRRQRVRVGGPGLLTLQATLLLKAGGAGLAGETVSFQVAGKAAGSGTTNSSGVASVSYTIPAGLVGSQTITATFAGDGTTLNSSQASGTLTVSKAGTVLTVPNVSGSPGQAVTLKATLALSAGGAGVANEPISFQVAGNAAGSGTTNSSGVASVSYTIPAGASGSEAIAATFSGDASYNTSQGSGTLTVSKVTTTLTVANVSGAVGQTATLKATLSPAVSGKTISFQVAGKAAGSGTTNSSGAATVFYKIATGTVGSQGIAATFGGDTTYNTSQGSGTLTVSKEGTVLGVGYVSGSVGQTVTLEAILTRSDNGTAISGETLSFQVAGTAVGSATTGSNGQATVQYKIPAGQLGNLKLVATFSGDANYTASQDFDTLAVSAAK